MKLIDKNTGKTLYSALGGENLTLDEAIEWAGAENTEGQTFIIDGEEYSYEDLDWVANSYQPDDEPEEPKSWAVRIALLHEDFPYDDETKVYYGFDEAEEDARFIAERIDKWEDSHSRRSRRPDDLPTDGGVDGYEIAFESSPELHIILNTQPAEKLLYSYVIDDGNLLKVVDEDAEGGIELRELLETKHSRAVELRFSYSFDELAKEVIIDGGKYITAEEAIEKYGFEKVANAAVEAVRHGYETDVFEKLAEVSDGEDDDINGYQNCIARLAGAKYSKQFYVDIIEDLASECLYKCFEI